MTADELKAGQSPLKQQYRDNPASASVVLSATGKLTDGITCTVETSAGPVKAGLHEAAGGAGTDACSGNMLLESLIACAGVTLRAVATGIGVDLRSAQITAAGTLDFRGTLGVAKDVPVGFSDIRLAFYLDTDASDEQVASLIRLTERYCVIYQTLRNSPAMTVSVSRRS